MHGVLLRLWFGSVRGNLTASCTYLLGKPASAVDCVRLSPVLACRSKERAVLVKATALPRVPLRLPMDVAEQDRRARVHIKPLAVDATPKPGCARCLPREQLGQRRDHAHQTPDTSQSSLAGAPFCQDSKGGFLTGYGPSGPVCPGSGHDAVLLEFVFALGSCRRHM